MIALPNRTDLPFYSFEIELDSRTYVFTFRWNDRDASWFFDVALLDGTRLATGRKVVLDRPLLQGFASADLPSGLLVALDSASGADRSGTPPNIDELGARVTINYIDLSELG